VRVRPAEHEDRGVLTAMLARAFDDDPVMRWVFPGRRARERYSGAFFRWSLWKYQAQNVTWTTDELAGAAVWALPDRWQVSPGELARLVLWTGRSTGSRGPRMMWGFATVGRRHSHDRHHGFIVTDELTLPKGPPVWLMRREPR
jgi:hypothetical protein